MVQKAHHAPGQRVDARQVVALPVHTQPFVEDVLHRRLRLLEEEAQQRVRAASKGDLSGGVDVEVGEIGGEALLVPDGQVEHRPAAQQKVRVFVVGEGVQVAAAAVGAERQQALRQGRLREADDVRGKLEERGEILGALEHQQPRRRRRLQRASGEQRVGGAAEAIQRQQQFDGLLPREISHQFEVLCGDTAPASVFDAGVRRGAKRCRQHGGCQPRAASHVERNCRVRWRCGRSRRRPAPAGRRGCVRRRSSAA